MLSQASFDNASNCSDVNEEQAINECRSVIQTLPIRIERGSTAESESYFTGEQHTDMSSAYIVDRVRRPSMKGRLCPYLSKTGVCKTMRKCAFSHTVEEARGHNLNFKTKICDFAANGFCKMANQCRYAHSYSELIPIDDYPPEEICGRDISSLTSTPETYQDSTTPSHSSIDSGETTSQHRVCYVAPSKQRKPFKQRQRSAHHMPIAIPSSFHYVEQIEKKRSGGCGPTMPLLHSPMPQPMIQVPPGHQLMFHPVTYQGTPTMMYAPIMYNMVMPTNVIYED